MNAVSRRKQQSRWSKIAQKHTASRHSMDYFSKRLKDFAPTEGLHRSDDIRGEVPDASTLKITTIESCVQKYLQARENASRGVIDDSFFVVDFNGIQEKAEALVRGEAYDSSDVENSYFVRSLCEFFVGSDEKKVASSYEALVREYADKLKNGEKPDIAQLQTKFSLWRGDDHWTGAYNARYRLGHSER